MKAFFNKINQICYYLILLISSIFFIALGLFFIFLSFSSSLKNFFISSILENSFLLIFIGLLLLSIATALLFKLSSSSSSRSIYVYKLGNGSVGVYKNVINQYIDSYLRDLFKENTIESQIHLKKNNILISASLPRTSDSEQLSLTKKIQNDIDQILKNILGESYKCVLRLKFKEK